MSTATRNATLHINLITGTQGDAVPCRVHTTKQAGKIISVHTELCDAPYSLLNTESPDLHCERLDRALTAINAQIAAGADTPAPYRDQFINALLEY